MLTLDSRHGMTLKMYRYIFFFFFLLFMLQNRPKSATAPDCAANIITPSSTLLNHSVYRDILKLTIRGKKIDIAAA